MMKLAGRFSLILVVVFFAGCSGEQTVVELLADSEGVAPDPKRAPAGRIRVVHRASIGGADICEAVGLPTGCDANFSLVAIEHADGSVSGQYHDQFAGGIGFHAAINCLNVVGNKAWVSGVITSGFSSGSDVNALVVDNGTSQNDPADQLSFSFIGNLGFDCNAQLNLQLFNLTNGQVKVQ